MPLATIGAPIKPLIADKTPPMVSAAGAAAAGVAAELTAFCRLPSVLFSVAEVPLLPTALLTAAACCPCPAGLVFWAGGVNGDSVAAAACAAADPYIAAASCAQNSPYMASLAAIAGVFWPRML